jgi:ribose 5-phosphate isomerase B
MEKEVNKVVLSSDHAGFKIKEAVKQHLLQKNYEVEDLGTYGEESCDYPDYAHKLAKVIEEGEITKGIAVCGSGNGINITLNKHQQIRAALCWNAQIARLARAHNDANVCSLPGRFISEDDAVEIVDTFLHTNFEGGRHARRVNKIPLSGQ